MKLLIMILIISGIVIHLIFMCAIFDVYFQSPIISDIQSQKNDIKPPAKRLALFVIDGLRAESLYGRNFEDMLAVSPHLCRKVKSNRAAWGVSHTRVPTSSRPGYVAITTGVYENPSAVTKGWKDYPVDFDTVFNESLHSWIWSNPMVMPFTKSENVEVHVYSSETDNFSGENASLLFDNWVFDRVDNLLIKNDHSEHTDKLLQSDKIIFCLILAEMDLAGHAYHPGSKYVRPCSHEDSFKILNLEKK